MAFLSKSMPMTSYQQPNINLWKEGKWGKEKKLHMRNADFYNCIHDTSVFSQCIHLQ